MTYALEVGDEKAARLLGVAYVTLAKAVAGWPVQRATRTHLVVMLERARAVPAAAPAGICSSPIARAR